MLWCVRSLKGMALPSGKSCAVWGLLAAVCAFAQTPSGFPLMQSCSTGADTIATLQAADALKIRYSFAGDNGTCYAVTATVGGNPVNGYLLGNAHPAIAAFEQDVRTQATLIPQPAPAPPPPAAAKPSQPPASQKPETAAAQPNPAPVEQPISFAGFRAIGMNGENVDLSRQRAANVVIYFWSARSRAGIKAADSVESVYNTYHARGVYVVGVASAASVDQLKNACSENEVAWPQVLDRSGLAARYHVDPAKPFLLLDQSRSVIAAAATPQALQPMLDQLTKSRRPRS